MKPTCEQLEAQSSKLADAVMTCVSKVEELQAQVKQLAAENAARKNGNGTAIEFRDFYAWWNIFNEDGLRTEEERMLAAGAWMARSGLGNTDAYQYVAPETPATDAYLAQLRNEARAEAIPEGYVLVPEQMYLEAGDIESICSQCGDGHENGYGDFTGAILWVGELADDDGKVKYGLNIASSECPEEGSVAIYEFAELREGKAGEVCNG